MSQKANTTWILCRLVGILLLLTSCSTMRQKQQEIQKENVLTKELRLFANDLATQIQRLSPENGRILVIEFTDLRKKFTYLGTYLSEKLSEELSQVDGMTLVNRADIELIMGELTFQQSGMVSQDDIVRIGEFSGANILISGTITDLGDEIDISAKITNIITSEVSPISFRMQKTKEKMALISAITIVEEEKEQELTEHIKQLQSEIDHRKQELERLMTRGAEEIEVKLREEEEQKRQELKDYYERRLNEIESAVQVEEQQKRQQLVLIEQQLREKSDILALLKEKEKELAAYENEINRIYQRIAKQNNAIENYLVCGMTQDDVVKLLGIRYLSISSGGYGTPHSDHGHYRIWWTDTDVVSGWTDMRTGQLHKRWVQ